MFAPSCAQEVDVAAELGRAERAARAAGRPRGCSAPRRADCWPFSSRRPSAVDLEAADARVLRVVSGRPCPFDPQPQGDPVEVAAWPGSRGAGSRSARWRGSMRKLRAPIVAGVKVELLRRRSARRSGVRRQAGRSCATIARIQHGGGAGAARAAPDARTRSRSRAAVDLAQVDLAQDAGVVPPAARRSCRPCGGRRRARRARGGGCRRGPRAGSSPVGPGAARQQLERQVAAGVARRSGGRSARPWPGS